MPKSSHIETLAVHAGAIADAPTGAIMTPIYLTSTFRQSAVGETSGYEYARTGNPTRDALQTALAELESGKHGLAFASGMAATDAVLHLLDSGDHVLANRDLYGGTYRIFEQVFRQLGVNAAYADASDPADFLDQLEPETRLVWLESPSNPLLQLSDIMAIAKGVHERQPKAVVCVDNTFATPVLQRPLELGADIVLHSSTKYLSGHSDVVGGGLIMQDHELAQSLAFIQNAVGAVPSPLDCFLVLRGLKTLAIRMERHCANASALADFLSQHPKVSEVYYPEADVRVRQSGAHQMSAGGGIISFRPRGGSAAARRVCGATKLFTLAESLGGVESLIELPAAMTHASTAGSTMEVPDDLIRLSVGIEHVDDLRADLEQALAV